MNLGNGKYFRRFILYDGMIMLQFGMGLNKVFSS